MSDIARPKTLAAAALMLAGTCTAPSQAVQPEDVFWLDAVDGAWDEPARWSTQTFYPENGVPDPDDTYRAIVDVTGNPYRVLMDDRFARYTVSELVLDSPDAVFHHSRGQFHVDSVELLRGVYQFDGSGTLATLEDAVINIHPNARFAFAGDNGFPRQPTGAFRRCTINGDLRLDTQNSGVLFEESVDIHGDIYLGAPGAAAGFNGLSMTLDHSTIYAGPNTSVEMFAVTGGFTLGEDARIIGTPHIYTRSGHGSPFLNAGEIRFTDTVEIEDLAFENAGLLTIESGRTSVLGSAARFSNSGSILITAGSELWLNFGNTSSNTGLIAIEPGGRLRSNVAFENHTDAVSEFLIDAVVGSGWMQLGDSRFASQLDGMLRIMVDDPGGFDYGDEYWLIRCPNYSGLFTELDLAPLDGGLSFAVEYRADGVYALVVPAPAPLGLLLAGALIPRWRRRGC